MCFLLSSSPKTWPPPRELNGLFARLVTSTQVIQPRYTMDSVSVVFGAPAAVAVSADAHAGHMLSDGRFFRSRLLLFLPNIVPSTLDTLFTPSLRLIGNPRSSCTARVSRNSEWNANDTPAKFSAALTS